MDRANFQLDLFFIFNWANEVPVANFLFEKKLK